MSSGKRAPRAYRKLGLIGFVFSSSLTERISIRHCYYLLCANLPLGKLALFFQIVLSQSRSAQYDMRHTPYEIGFDWLCFFAVREYAYSRNHLSLLRFGSFSRLANWLCFVFSPFYFSLLFELRPKDSLRSASDSRPKAGIWL